MTYSEQVNSLIAKLKVAFGLGDWTISVQIGRNETIGINDGFASTDAKYCTAHIDIAADLDEERLQHVVYHEMLHVAIEDMIAPLRLFSHSLPPKQKEYVDSLIEYHVERTIERIATALPEHMNGSVD